MFREAAKRHSPEEVVEQNDQAATQNQDPTKTVFEKMSTEQPLQTEKELFLETDAKGYNCNPSEQNFYPGVQRHADDSAVEEA